MSRLRHGEVKEHVPDKAAGEGGRGRIRPHALESRTRHHSLVRPASWVGIPLEEAIPLMTTYL